MIARANSKSNEPDIDEYDEKIKGFTVAELQEEIEFVLSLNHEWTSKIEAEKSAYEEKFESRSPEEFAELDESRRRWSAMTDGLLKLAAVCVKEIELRIQKQEKDLDELKKEADDG